MANPHKYRPVRQEGITTKFCAEHISSPDEATEVFGNYTPQGRTPILCTVDKGCCSCYVFVPEGSYALVTKSGKAVGVWDPGFHWCSPFTNIQYLVTMQHVVFDLPIKQILTADNIQIEIDCSIVLKIKEGFDNVQNFCYKTNPDELTSLLEAALNERVRVLARGKTHLDAYAIKGKQHTEGMVTFLNKTFGDKGVEITSVIITNVLLDKELADTLEEKTTYQSKNEFERKKQCYELLVLQDEQAIELLRQTKTAERDAEKETYKKRQAEIQKDHNKINAQTEKEVSEKNEQMKAKVNEITTNSQLAAQEIQAETEQISAKIKAEGDAEALRLKAESDAYVQKKEAEIQKEVATKKAQAIEYEGKIEAEAGKMLSAKRDFEANMRQLAVLHSLAQNPNFTVFGAQNDNLMAQVAAFRMTNSKL